MRVRDEFEARLATDGRRLGLVLGCRPAQRMPVRIRRIDVPPDVRPISGTTVWISLEPEDD